MADGFRFQVRSASGDARAAEITTPHGSILTPAFMPVGTRAAVKAVAPVLLREAGSQILLANTYHLMLRPGADVVQQLGGLPRFMGWDGPVLTDSGGFQVFSLADLRRLDEDGVEFRSHIDGTLVRLTPEASIAVQNQLGADIIMAFDECPPLPCEPAALSDAVRRTTAWAARSRAAHARPEQALYGIVQGGLDAALRKRCLEQLVDIGFDGYALGGLSVGEPPPDMWAFLADFVRCMPPDHPRYLMGVGMPRDLVEAVASGIDQFDCVLPTRNGRKGYAFTSEGVLRLRNACHRVSREPLDPRCDCYTCRTFQRGYLRHLIMDGEALGGALVSLHNVRFYHRLMEQMRAAILDGSFPQWRRHFLSSAAVVRKEEQE